VSRNPTVNLTDTAYVRGLEFQRHTHILNGITQFIRVFQADAGWYASLNRHVCTMKPRRSASEALDAAVERANEAAREGKPWQGF
jgi:hypothetical protein